MTKSIVASVDQSRVNLKWVQTTAFSGLMVLWPITTKVSARVFIPVHHTLYVAALPVRQVSRTLESNYGVLSVKVWR